MHQLVPYHLLKVGVGAVEGYDHPSFVELSKPGHALRDQVGNHVGLLKVCRRTVDDQRYLAEDMVVELIL